MLRKNDQKCAKPLQQKLQHTAERNTRTRK